MAKISRLAGSTSHIITLFIQDSSSTSGAGLTGLAFGTSGLTCYYKRNKGTASVAVSLVNITTLGTYVSGGFKEVDAANLPGFYEFHPPDLAIAAGSGSVAFLLKGATNMSPMPVEIELTGVDNQDSIAGGMSRLDTNVASRSTYSGGAVATVTDKAGYSLAAGSVSSATFTLGAVSASATGILERLMLLVWRFFPQGSGKVTMPKSPGSGGASARTYGSDGTTVIATQTATDDGTTQTLGAAS